MTKLIWIVAIMTSLMACNTDPTRSNTSVVNDCRAFAPANCIQTSVSGNLTGEYNGRAAPDAYRYCYCLNETQTEVLQYAAPTKALLGNLR